MRGLVCTLALGVLATSALGQEIRWQPVAATGNVVCLPGSGDCGAQEVILSAGGVTVTLFLEVSGWDTATPHAGDSNFFLGAFQGTVDSTSYVGGAAVNPGTLVGQDLNPVGQDTGMGFEGAFQALKVCSSDFFDPLASDLLTSCATSAECPPSHPFCVDRFDYVFYQLDSTATVSTATIDYSWSAASTDCLEDPRDGTRFYGGTLLLEVPGGAKGTYNVSFFDDVNFTLFNSCPGPLIPGLILVPGQITIQTGKCCFGIGQGEPVEGCLDDLTAAECAAQAAPRLEIDPDSTCADGCIECVNDVQCDDGNDCTDDSCNIPAGNVCDNIENFEVGVVCCNPTGGATEVIDDDFFCTEDVCDPDTGIVAHNPITAACTAGDADHDGNPSACFYDFQCVDGLCEGTDINTVPCGTIDDCPDGSSACEDTGVCGEALCCKCSVCSDISIEVAAGPKPDDNCFLLGGAVDMTVQLNFGSATVIGGQFLINYDPTCLDFGGAAGAGPFVNIPYYTVDEAAGTIFVVVLVDDVAAGTKGPSAMMTMSFTKLDGCDECDVCFDSINPTDTLLTDSEGYSVEICDLTACSKPVRLAGDIEVTGPAGAAINSDCGLPTALVEWDMPTAYDTCDGDMGVMCSGAYAHNVGEPAPDASDLVMMGGEFEQGLWFFQCTATNTCGNADQHVWTVDVSDQNALDIEVHLAPPIEDDLSRCICFELFADCYADPTEVCTVMDFGPPANFAGHARETMKVDKDNYLCVTAQDPYHTLRSSADIECVDNAWKAIWKGDPLLGGNWLIGGNLDGLKAEGTGSPNVIDVLDFGKLIVEMGMMYADGDTDCVFGEDTSHGDINGDGVVDAQDFAIIQMNFLMHSKNACCPEGQAVAEPILSADMKLLRSMGLSELSAADLNRDGVLDVRDMTAYQQGTDVRKRTSSR